MADATAPSPTNQPSAGRILPFGKYLLLQRVSVGGMAEIFKAVPEGATRLDNILAIKRILPNIAEDAEFIGMFVDEARIAGQLTHPNICRIYELGKVGQTNYIAMQFLWGRDLLKVINRFKRVGRNAPPSLIAHVCARACAGLHYAHIKRDASGQPLRIIHRDVSPQNISVGYSGQVKLIDFGVARAASQSQKTQAGVLKGKFGYMSPEMVKGFDIDARSDVFAMGICLWEGLTGQRLFYGESDFATLELVREARVDEPSTKAEGIPPELDAVVMRALAAEPNDRFGSAAELQAALEEVLAIHYSGFQSDDVSLIMQQAFAHEVRRERLRLSVFEDMAAAGTLVRGAELPPLPAESGASQEITPAEPEDEVKSSDSQATVVHPVSEEDLARLSGSFDAMHDEATTIFFSADELEQIAELSDEQEVDPARNPLHVEPSSPGMPMPAASDVMMPGPQVSLASRPEVHQWTDLSAFDTLPPESGPVRHQRGPMAVSAVPMHLPSETIEFSLDSLDSGLGATSSRGASVWLVVLAVLIGVMTYFGLRSLRATTGELQIEVTGPEKSLVQVDNVLRGHPPLMLADVTPGEHLIKVDAEGFGSAVKEVHVDRGRSTLVQLMLVPSAQKRAADALAIEPHVERSTPPVTAPVDTQAAPTEAAAADEAPADPALWPEASRTTTPQASPTRGATRADDEPATPAPVAKRRAPATPVERPVSIAPVDEPASDATEAEVTTMTDAPEAAPPEQPQDFSWKSAPPLAAQDPGTLVISTLPWSRVFLDGKDTGQDTPIRGLEVSPGRHSLGFKTSDGRMHTVDVLVKPGEKVRIIRRFSLPAY